MAEHGTIRGFRRHRTLKEPACDPCKRAAARDAGPRSEARAAAARRLIAAHRAEFDQLYAEEKVKAGLTPAR